MSYNNRSLTHKEHIIICKSVLLVNKCIKFYYSDYQILRYHSKFLEDILTIRPQDRERCNMLLMLLVVSYFFILRYHSKFLEDILTSRPQDRERCNMLLMLLVVSYFCYNYPGERYWLMWASSILMSNFDYSNFYKLPYSLGNKSFTSCHLFGPKVYYVYYWFNWCFLCRL